MPPGAEVKVDAKGVETKTPSTEIKVDPDN
jgi:hypothetical protein